MLPREPWPNFGFDWISKLAKIFVPGVGKAPGQRRAGEDNSLLANSRTLPVQREQASGQFCLWNEVFWLKHFTVITIKYNKATSREKVTLHHNTYFCGYRLTGLTTNNILPTFCVLVLMGCVQFAPLTMMVQPLTPIMKKGQSSQTTLQLFNLEIISSNVWTLQGWEESRNISWLITNDLLIHSQLSGPLCKRCMTKPLVQRPAKNTGRAWLEKAHREGTIYHNKLHEQGSASIPLGLPKPSFGHLTSQSIWKHTHVCICTQCQCHETSII